MTNFSGVGRQGVWSWLTPERAVLVMPIFAGFGLSMALVSFGVTPLAIRVREQRNVVEQLTCKADFVPVLRQQLDVLNRKNVERIRQLDRLLELVAGTSELQTFLAGLNDLGRTHNVAITTTKPGAIERFKAEKLAQPEDALSVGAGDPPVSDVDPLLNPGLEKRSASLTVRGSFQQVLRFLQSLESLEVFVVVSDMNVQGQSRRAEEDVERPEIIMDLTLTAYGRQRMSPGQLVGNGG